MDFTKKSKHDGILRSIGWHRVVLDEGMDINLRKKVNESDRIYPAHIIRNPSSRAFKAVYDLSAKHRWCITATPIQNWVQELGVLVKFLRVSPFDDNISFREIFTYPIECGDEHGWERLRSLVQAISLRRTKEAVDLKLPLREQIIQPVELSMEEGNMYKLFTKSWVAAIETRGMARSSLQNILRLRQICNHGRELLPPKTQQWLDSVMSLDDNPTSPPLICEQCDSPMADSEAKMCDLNACVHQICKACLRDFQEGDKPSEPVCPICSELGQENEFQRPDEMEIETQYRPSSKVKALLQNLQKARCQSQHPQEVPIKRYR